MSDQQPDTVTELAELLATGWGRMGNGPATRLLAEQVHAWVEERYVPPAEDEKIMTMLGSSAHALAEAHRFRQAVLDLAAEWVAFPNEAAPPYRPLDANRCAAELRALVERAP